MWVLALDTTSRDGSVALIRDDAVVIARPGDAGVSHAERIPADLRAILADAGLPLGAVDVFAVATGPGGFTGLRIGVGMSWLAIVAAEMLIGGVGIGFFIWDAWNSSRISDIIVALVYIGIVGFLLDKLIATVGHFVSHGVSAQ